MRALLVLLIAASSSIGCSDDKELPPPGAHPIPPGTGGTGGEPSGNGGAGGSLANGEPCTAAAACARDICFSSTCREACAGGTCAASLRCVSVEDEGVCLPDLPGLCESCVEDADCPYPSDRCVVLPEGRFCSRDCSFQPCPSGFDCAELAYGKQCLPASGTCSCLEITDGQQRSCEVRNEFGACAGIETCDGEAGRYGGCTARTPAAEQCNGVDDDCDGFVDESFDVGTPCEVGTGACHGTGVRLCASDGTAVCSTSAGTPSEELCGNGVDDDCDGEIDETFLVGAPCEVGVGSCRRTGHVVCTPDLLSSVCDVEPGEPTEERCNALDDDCDGVFDEGFDLGATCTAGVGACARTGVRSCLPDGTAGCSATPGAPTTETCNGIDDDCDAETDEGIPGVGEACETGLPGPCGAGVQACGTSGLLCAPAQQAAQEICEDGIDQNCDGADSVCPPDTCDDALLLASGTAQLGDLSVAFDDHAPPAGAGADPGGADAIYRIELTEPSVLYLDTFGSAADTVLTLRSGACDGPVVKTANDACGGVQSQLVHENLPAGTYFLWIDARTPGTAGTYRVTAQSAPCAGAQRLQGTAGAVAGSTLGQVTSSTFGSCGGRSGPDVPFFFTLCPGTFQPTFDTCGSDFDFDTVLYVRERSCADTAPEKLCADDGCALVPHDHRSKGAATLTGPGLFWVFLDGFGDETGNYRLSWSGL